MAEQKVEQKVVEAKKADKAKPRETAVSLLKAHALKGCKDRAHCVKRAFQTAQAKKVTHNSKGKPITEENLATLLNAMCRDITNEKKGWWKQTKLEETETSFKFIPRN